VDPSSRGVLLSFVCLTVIRCKNNLDHTCNEWINRRQPEEKVNKHAYIIDLFNYMSSSDSFVTNTSTNSHELKEMLRKNPEY
jgi:hypothetical protein